MTSMRHDVSPEDIANELIDQAKKLWGDQRAQQLRSSLGQTARHLQQLSQNLPNRDTEPGCHPIAPNIPR